MDIETKQAIKDEIKKEILKEIMQDLKKEIKLELKNEDENKYFCEKCNYRCKFKSLFIKHTKSIAHIGENNEIPNDLASSVLSCDKCNFKTFYSQNFKNHKLNNHSSFEERKKEFPFFCEVCNIGFFSKILLNNHNSSKKHLMRTQS
jgi:hypothetical protein